MKASSMFLGIVALCSALVVGGCMDMGGYYDEYGAPSSAGYEADRSMPAAPDSADQFDDVGVNPFVEADHDPFSTFAADVDTASYDVFRQWMQDGDVPPAASVRLEEYVNYFDYDYPAPTTGAEVPFDISLATAGHPVREDMVVLRVGIQAAGLPDPSERPRANLVFLIDVSGSMSSAGKLDLVQRLLSEAVDRLRPDDTISIVTYAGSTSVRLEPTPVSESARIVGVIGGLSSGGGTAGAAGIDLAYEQAHAAFVDGGINQVVLCTDGDFNIGPSSSEELVEIIEERRRGGVTLTALGFGRGNLNDGMMELVSNAGNGIYSVIYDEDRAVEFLDRHLFSSIVHVAKDMKIQVEFNPEHVAAYRLLGYVNRAIADDDFRVDTVDAGEVGAGHRVTALYEVVLAGGSAPTPSGAPDLDAGDPVDGEREIQAGNLVQVRVRFKEVGAAEEDPASEVSESLPVGTAVVAFDGADDDFQWAVAVALFAERLGESPFDQAEAAGVITAVTDAQAGRDPARAEFARLAAAAIASGR